MRAETSRGFPAAYLSRQVVGVRRRALVVALPGSPRGAADCLDAIMGLIPHAIALIKGEKPDHPH
jgi:molybdopterin biosynthesis enzyme MoaB